MKGTWIAVDAPDGGRFEAYLAKPAQGSGPGLVLCQEIFGVNEDMRRMADLYAEEGYVVLVPDLFWRFEPDIELGHGEADLRRALELSARLDTAGRCRTSRRRSRRCGATRPARAGSAWSDTASAGAWRCWSLPRAASTAPSATTGSASTRCLTAGRRSQGADGAALRRRRPVRAGRGGARDPRALRRTTTTSRSTSTPTSTMPSRTPDGQRTTSRPPTWRTRARSRCCAVSWDRTTTCRHCGRRTAPASSSPATSTRRCATMVDEPYVNHIPTLTGGYGHDYLQPLLQATTSFRSRPRTSATSRSRARSASTASSTKCCSASRTTARSTGCCRACRRPASTSRCALVGIITFRGDKLMHEHIYWDQASVLVQIGLLDPDRPAGGRDRGRAQGDRSQPAVEHADGELARAAPMAERLPATIGGRRSRTPSCW